MNSYEGGKGSCAVGERLDRLTGYRKGNDGLSHSLSRSKHSDHYICHVGAILRLKDRYADTECSTQKKWTFYIPTAPRSCGWYWIKHNEHDRG